MVYLTSQDRNLYALGEENGARLWRYTTAGNITGSAAVTGEVVYVASHDGRLYAINKAGGGLRWRYDAGEVLWSSPAVAGGKVFVTSETGTVFALDATVGSLVWKYVTGGAVYGSATVVGEIVLVASASGELRWKTEIGSGSHSTPAVLDGLVYVGSWDERVYALDVETGALKWNFWTGAKVLSSAATDEESVYIGSDDGYLYALDAETGKLRWRFETGAEVRSTPVASNGMVYSGSYDDYLYAIDVRTGALVWKLKTGDIRGRLAATENTVYAGSRDDSLYAVATGDLPEAEIGVATTTTAPTAAFVSMAPEEIVNLVNGIYASLPTLGAKSTRISGGTVTTLELSFVSESVDIFETGYHLLTGVTPREDGWVPRIFSKEDYAEFIDEEKGGDPFLKEALAFCCHRSPEGLGLIINGSFSSASVVSSLAHEAGHARQRIRNPVQIVNRDTNVGALREAEAFAFETALIRALGDYTGLNATKLIFDQYEIRPWVEGWSDRILESIDDVAEEHTRGHAILWLAVLHDPELSALGAELAAGNALSPSSLLTLYDYLAAMTPGEADAYVDGLLVKFRESKRQIENILLTRTSTGEPGFFAESSSVFLVP